MRGGWAAIAVLVLAGCGSGAAAPGATEAEIPAHGVDLLTRDAGYFGEGPAVAVLGDSLINAVHDELHDELDGWSVSITAAQGEGVLGGPWTDEYDMAAPLLATRAEGYAEGDPAVVVLAVGTNDAWTGSADPVPELERLLGLFDGCVVGVLVAEDTDAVGYDRAVAGRVNETLRVEADVVVDWRLHAGASDVGSDGIHLTEQGRAGYLEAIADAVNDC